LDKNSSTTGVLLLAHGSPDRVEEVPEFLRYVTSGRPLPPQVVDEIKHRYGLIGRSPLRDYTLQQAEALSRELGLPVFVGMRNWTPFISEAIQQITSQGIQRVIAICMAPQNSRTSVGLYRKALMGDTSQLPFEVDFVESWHDQPLLIRAFAEKLKAGWEKACSETSTRMPVIFTAHSVPQRTVAEGDPYEHQAKETAELVAMAVPSLAVDDWRFALQSQGMSGGPWLGPTVEDTISILKGKGNNAVFLAPIGFLCDHVEVLYDIDILFKEFAAQQGMKLSRSESLNGSPLLTSALAEVARSRMPSVEQPKPTPLVQLK